MRNCQIFFQRMTAGCEDIFSLQIYFYPASVSHTTVPSTNQGCKNNLICRSTSAAGLFCNALPSVFQMKSCNFAPAKTYISHKMQAFYTIILLLLSNVFMTFAWYGHLKLQQTGTSSHWPLIAVILFSWGVALFEYCCQVPANRIGFVDNGGPFSLIQLKVIQEVVSLIVFTIIVTTLFRGESLHWNHMVAFCCLVVAVYFVFK